MDATSFLPLTLEDRVMGEPLEKASELVKQARALIANAHGPVAKALVPLLRQMNSYYSNKIEGQHTTPSGIERALKKEYAADRDEQRKQLTAIAHIQAEEQLEAEWNGHPLSALFDAQKVQRIHQLCFEKLPPEYRVTDDGAPIDPGQLRGKNVKVGEHEAPPPELLQRLLTDWSRHYQRVKGHEHQLIAVACSHHRLAWVHPFIDGNGRVCRLHSHLALHASGLTDGLWSPLRGFARTHEAYYRHLSDADQQRRNDLDGRGNLSQEELVKFVHYFLDCCLDQVTFMLKMVELDGMRSRVRDYLEHLDRNPWQIGAEKSVIRPEKTVLPLEIVAQHRPLSRAEFAQMVGESESTTRRIIRSLLDAGVLSSASHKDDLQFTLPQKSLRFLFPKLWPEVDSE